MKKKHPWYDITIRPKSPATVSACGVDGEVEVWWDLGKHGSLAILISLPELRRLADAMAQPDVID